MANFMLMFRGIPDGDKYEAAQNELRSAFEKITEIENSEDFKEYQKLKELVESSEFKSSVKEIKSKKYKGSEAYRIEQSFVKLQKDKGIKLYLKTVESGEAKRYEEIEKGEKLAQYIQEKEYVESKAYKDEVKYLKLSPKKKFKQSEEFKTFTEFQKIKKSTAVKKYLKESDKEEKPEPNQEVDKYLELDKLVHSSEFTTRKKDIENRTLENSEAYKRKQNFDALSKDADIVFFQEFGKSKAYKNYQAIHGSDKLTKYHELKEQVESEEFKVKKEYLLLPATKKYEQSDEYVTEKRYEELNSSEHIQFYLKNKGHKKYNWFESWNLTFQDAFEGKDIDSDKWMNKYFWGDAMIQDSYSLMNEHQSFTNANLTSNGNSLSIETRKEETEGKQWNENFGFVPHNFPYSSGLLSTGNSFRQQYGTFEAKVRFTNPEKITHAFWLVGEQMLPHINVFKSSAKIEQGNYWGALNEKNQSPHTKSTLPYSKLKTPFNIFRIVWDDKQIEWQINGTTIFKSKKGIPQEAMYLVFSSHVFNKDTDVQQAEMEIDWVRVYSK